MSYQRNLAENILQLQLLLAERPRSQSELTTFLGINRKAVKRAVDRLSLHYPVSEERQGRNVFYRAEEFQSPVFTPTELAALILAQEAIVATGQNSLGSPFADAADSLIRKVKEKLPIYSRDKLDSLAAVFGSAVIPSKDFSQHTATIEILTKAATDKITTALRYHNLTGNKVTERKFDPYAVYSDPDGATLKVIGFDHRRQNVIPFSIDHIRKIALTKDVFTRPNDFDLRSFLEQNCFNGIHGERLKVRLKAFGVTARIFAERQFHPSQKIISSVLTNDCEEIEIAMHVAGGRGLERFILSWLPDIEVVAPAELKNQIAEIGQKAFSRHFQK